jgi:Cu+-exporting ATPase
MTQPIQREEIPVTDPVCGMSVNEQTAPTKAEHDGKTYYFCSTGCKTKFQKDPTAYVTQGATAH